MAKTRKYIITGATGKIGTELLKVLNKDDFVAFTRSPNKLDKSVKKFVVDLSKNIETHRFKEYDTVIHLAAETHIDRCEDDKKKKKNSSAWINNVVVTKNLVEFCAATSKKLIMLSSESVFGGAKRIYSEDDKPLPKSWYGITKYESEKVVQKYLEDYVILRTVMAYGGDSNKTDLPKFIYQKLINGEKVYLDTGQKIAFTHISDIIKGLLLSSRKNLRGVYHFCGPDVLTPFGLGKLIVKKYNLNRKLIIPRTSVELHGIRRAHLRLRNAILSNKKFVEKTGYKSFTGIEKGLENIYL